MVLVDSFAALSYLYLEFVDVSWNCHIRRLSTAGGPIEEVSASAQIPCGQLIGIQDSNLYWIARADACGRSGIETTIYRLPLTGPPVPTTVDTVAATGGVEGIAIDSTSAYFATDTYVEPDGSPDLSDLVRIPRNGGHNVDLIQNLHPRSVARCWRRERAHLLR
jgi:hypothetical protein